MESHCLNGAYHLGIAQNEDEEAQRTLEMERRSESQASFFMIKHRFGSTTVFNIELLVRSAYVYNLFSGWHVL